MALSSPVSPRDLGLKEKKFQSIEDSEAAYNLIVRRLNEVYKYNRRDHDRLTEDVEDVSGGGSLTIEAHTSDDTLTEAESGSVHTNLGATGTVTLTLPDSAAAGTYFTFASQVPNNDQELRVDPGSATIRMEGVGAGKYIYHDEMGVCITLVADENGDWVPITQSQIDASYVNWNIEGF